MLILMMHELVSSPLVTSGYANTSVVSVKQSLPLTIVSFATDFSLVEALAEIRRFEIAFQRRYNAAHEFMLLSVSEVPFLSKESLNHARLTMVEDLMKGLE